MNSLSWFIYGISVLEGVRNIATISCIVGLVILLLGLMFLGLVHLDRHMDHQYFQIEKLPFPKFLRNLLVTVVVNGIVVSALPPKETLYAIAVSEIGEKILVSETGQEIVNDATKALRQWIKAQIKEEKAQ